MQETRASVNEFGEVGDFVSALRTLEATAVAFPSDHFGASIAAVRLEDIAVEVVRTRPILLMAAAAEGRTGCLVMLDGERGARWNGRAVEREDVAVLAPGTALAAACRDDCACAFVSTDAAAPFGTTALGLEGELLARRGPGRIARTGRSAQQHFAALVRSVEDVAACGPDVLDQEEPRRALRDSLTGAVLGMLRAAAPAEARRRRAPTRHLVVRRVDEYLRASPSRPVYTEELCAALGVSASALHEAFHATFGVSPHRYLKLRRMGMARAMLLSRDAPWRSVKAAALSHGFWHLGQFALDYRAIYGESPGETLARAR